MYLLEDIAMILNCYYISDLHFQPYNKKARRLFKLLNLNNYSKEEVLDAEDYIFN
jgi:hypothetical protein